MLCSRLSKIVKQFPWHSQTQSFKSTLVLPVVAILSQDSTISRSRCIAHVDVNWICWTHQIQQQSMTGLIISVHTSSLERIIVEEAPVWLRQGTGRVIEEAMGSCRGRLRRVSARLLSNLGAGVDQVCLGRLDIKGNTRVFVELRIDRNALISLQLSVGKRGREVPGSMLWVESRVDVGGWCTGSRRVSHVPPLEHLNRCNLSRKIDVVGGGQACWRVELVLGLRGRKCGCVAFARERQPLTLATKSWGGRWQATLQKLRGRCRVWREERLLRCKVDDRAEATSHVLVVSTDRYRLVEAMV